MMHPAHREELRQSILWFLLLLGSLGLVRFFPAPDAAHGVAGYAPLHTAMEVVSIAVAAMVFGISWVTQKYRTNSRAVALGLGLLGVAVLDLSHSLSYASMPAFVTASGPEKAINFWLAARSLAALALLWAAFFPPRWSRAMGPRLRYAGLLGVLLLVGVVHYVLLLQPQALPRTFEPGSGLTQFKVRYEYLLIALYGLAGAGFLAHLRGARESGLARLALASFTMAMGEYFFTLYANVTDVYNVAGHLYKILAYGFLYRALFVETVQTPYQDLQASELRQRATLSTLPDRLFEVDRQGVYLAVHTQDAGRPPAPADELIGRRLDAVLPADAAARCMEALAEAERLGSSRGQRMALALPDGTAHFELAVARKSDARGGADTYLVLSRDITATVENEQRIRSEAQLNAALLDLQHHDALEEEQVFLRRGAEHACRLTGSALASLHFVQDDQRGTTPAVSTGDAAAMARAAAACTRALHERRTVVLNTVPALGDSAPGTGAAHRLVSLPVIEGGKVRMLLGVADKAEDYGAPDVQALQTLAEALWKHTLQRRQEAVIHRLSEALGQSPNPVVITDTAARIIYVNHAFSEVSGYSAPEVLGRNPRMLHSGLTPRATYDDMWSRLPLGQPWQGEFINRRKNGQTYTESASLYPIRDAFGQVTHYVAHKEDITLRREAQERIQALSNNDTLTGLLNKKAFDEQLAQVIDRAAAGHERVSVLWFDIDNFKLVNETLGHAAGDELLVAMGNRLRACLEPQIALARYSGDAFVAIVPRADQAAVALMAQEALAQLQTPLQVHGHPVSVSASAGVAVCPDDARTPGALASAAEVAMYRVKEDGRNGLRFFAPDMQAHTQRSLEMATCLKEAAQRGEFYMVYQPQRALGSGALVGAEALLRWRHPQWGLVSPAEFIPIAEQSGSITAIDFWVVEQVALQLRAWDAAGLPPLVVAVNVSAAQFARPRFVDELLQVLQRVDVSPTRMEVELTEAVSLKYPEQAETTIRRLHDAGFRVALDDFGTGYSSMGYLKRYAIDKIKIDQSFVRELADQTSDQAIVTAIIKMAQSLHMATIAEGVETAAQAGLLQAFGCDEMQGYWYSKPLEADAFAAFAQRSAVPA